MHEQNHHSCKVRQPKPTGQTNNMHFDETTQRENVGAQQETIADMLIIILSKQAKTRRKVI